MLLCKHNKHVLNIIFVKCYKLHVELDGSLTKKESFLYLKIYFN